MVKRETIIELCLGKDWEEFLLIERQNTVAALLNAARSKGDTSRETEIKRMLEGSNTAVPEMLAEGYMKQTQQMPIKEILQAELGPRIKWRLKIAYNAFGK
jgi:glutamyl-tRNA reductase